ncbi:TPA: hypothetical protein P9G21_004680 [Pseudomonas aeruginosa]|nr:hypothetical protein [Pseudomonas aeruginosa]
MTTSKIQMDQIRSTSATVTGENIRAGSQKKSSLSQAEGLQGASPDATCTCPSGDGSLVHPCPAHPASVEQAGGDERAAFEAAYQTEHAGFMGPLKLERREDGEYKSEHVGSAWRMWQARAALAQPSPVSEALIYACKNLAQITSSDGSGHADIALAILRMAGVCDDERERLVNEWKAARAWKPSPAQAEQAEAERPEVVAWRYGFSGGIVSDKACLDEWKSGGEYQSLMTVAQHERIVGALTRDHAHVEEHLSQQIDILRINLAAKRDNLDAALARVAELTATRNRYGVDAHYFNKNLQLILRDFESFTPDELARSLIILAKVADEKVVAQAQQLHDMDKQCREDVARALGLRPSQERGFAWSYLLASIKSCVKAAEDTAQAQHSVPEASEQEKELGWTLDYRFVERVTDLAASRTEYTTSMEATEQVLLAARELLAAAPGKEVSHE